MFSDYFEEKDEEHDEEHFPTFVRDRSVDDLMGRYPYPAVAAEWQSLVELEIWQVGHVHAAVPLSSTQILFSGDFVKAGKLDVNNAVLYDSVKFEWHAFAPLTPLYGTVLTMCPLANISTGGEDGSMTVIAGGDFDQLFYQGVNASTKLNNLALVTFQRYAASNLPQSR